MAWWLWLILGWGWGGWAVLMLAEHLEGDMSPGEVALMLMWPVVVPTAKAYHWWRWGIRKRRWLYTDLKWWQRGLSEPRSSRKATSADAGTLGPDSHA